MLTDKQKTGHYFFLYINQSLINLSLKPKWSSVKLFDTLNLEFIFQACFVRSGRGGRAMTRTSTVLEILLSVEHGGAVSRKTRRTRNLHSAHQLFRTQAPAELRAGTVRSKHPLEDLSGSAVQGVSGPGGYFR